MKGTITLKVSGDVNAVVRQLRDIDRRIVPRVTARALNYSVARIKSASIASIAAQAGIPRGALTGKKAGAAGSTKRRASRFIIRGRANAAKQFVDFIALVLPVLSSAVGRPKAAPDYGGAFAGQYFWKGGFVQRMRSGHAGVFKRTHPSRRVGPGARSRPHERGALPVQEQTVRIEPMASTTIRRHLNLTGRPAFTREFRRLLMLRLR